MFGLFKVEKKIETPAEQRLEEIKNLLFPPLELKEKYDSEYDETIKYHIDHSIDTNLDAAKTDIEEGYTDKPVINTINNALDRLYKVRNLLEAHMEIDKDAKYIIVDNYNKEVDIDDEDLTEV